MNGETDRLPGFYAARIERDLGELHQYLPPGATMHDPNAHLKSVNGDTAVTLIQGGRRARAGAAAASRSPALSPAWGGG